MSTAAVFFVLLACLSSVMAHGFMTSPLPRYAFLGLNPQITDLSPVEGANTTDFVCRNQKSVGAPMTVLTAGRAFNITWYNQALHQGDCAIYISYQGDTDNLAEMQWFKIANIYDCRNYIQTNMSIYLPEYLPSSKHAVLRWEWYATHKFPNIEFFAECVDIAIKGCEGGSIPQPLVSIPGNLPYDGHKYRDPWNNWGFRGIVGPAIAKPTVPNPAACPAGGNFNDKYDYHGSDWTSSGDVPPTANPTGNPTGNPTSTPPNTATQSGVCVPGKYACNGAVAVLCTGSGANAQWSQVDDCGARGLGCKLINQIPYCV